MRDAVALQRYLQRHIEPQLPSAVTASQRWRHAVVIPAYREDASLLERLRAAPAAVRGEKNLVVLVINRPSTEANDDINAPLRQAISGLKNVSNETGVDHTLALRDDLELFLLDLDQLRGPLPADEGVGLARKAGCDLALRWIHEGAIKEDWVCNTDADACLPPDYFTRLQSLEDHHLGAVFPFVHIPSGNEAIDTATALYELRLHQYVLGLEFAESPYALHTLGSCLALRAGAYAHVRGVPKRAGAEDFYLLNKLAKLGPVARLKGRCIQLLSRASSRVPFGTGPAVKAIAEGRETVFYHPQCFEALRCVLRCFAGLAAQPDADLADLIGTSGLQPKVAQAALHALQHFGIETTLAHCRRQGRTHPQFLQHLTTWFDGQRSLQFIHRLRDDGWRTSGFTEIDRLTPQLWPPHDAQSVTSLREAIHRHWGWQNGPRFDRR
ncbi:MAG: glycosyltransferase family A protein [Pseudomonadota bacterium]